jgi:hypothetical protein
MAAPTNIGVTLITHATAQSVEVSSKGDVKILTDKAGAYSNAAVQDPTFEFSARGKGAACPVALKAATGPSGVSGKVIVTTVKESTSNDDWEEWEYSGSAYPAAT